MLNIIHDSLKAIGQKSDAEIITTVIIAAIITLVRRSLQGIVMIIESVDLKLK
ncbi:hypothetical protein NWP17_10770 [Chrysosporum bergii ANA360D]|uniref:Uncharacterized protein n=1 Tax=Chrysosporum bergii ANA360D TaxID=617107 RepID=A0AA43GTV4_9CYAN|nr:hypothetical protein [Chrysosporum bergii]MDH6060917.1 hypothetical protein [Chrysosporum bergii ANA360D]